MAVAVAGIQLYHCRLTLVIAVGHSTPSNTLYYTLVVVHWKRLDFDIEEKYTSYRSRVKFSALPTVSQYTTDTSTIHDSWCTSNDRTNVSSS
jgi:hypothetical protein